MEISKPKVQKNNLLITVLDKSGSMSGAPFRALLEGAQQVVKR
jgi:hypothetical protein